MGWDRVGWGGMGGVGLGWGEVVWGGVVWCWVGWGGVGRGVVGWSWVGGWVHFDWGGDQSGAPTAKPGVGVWGGGSGAQAAV